MSLGSPLIIRGSIICGSPFGGPLESPLISRGSRLISLGSLWSLGLISRGSPLISLGLPLMSLGSPLASLGSLMSLVSPLTSLVGLALLALLRLSGLVLLSGLARWWGLMAAGPVPRTGRLAHLGPPPHISLPRPGPLALPLTLGVVSPLLPLLPFTPPRHQVTARMSRVAHRCGAQVSAVHLAGAASRLAASLHR